MTEIATIDWFGRWGTSVFSENTAIFPLAVVQWSNLPVSITILDKNWHLQIKGQVCHVYDKGHMPHKP